LIEKELGFGDGQTLESPRFPLWFWNGNYNNTKANYLSPIKHIPQYYAKVDHINKTTQATDQS